MQGAMPCSAGHARYWDLGAAVQTPGGGGGAAVPKGAAPGCPGQFIAESRKRRDTDLPKVG